MLILKKQVKRQSAVGQMVWTKAVIQKIRLFNITGWRDSLIGLKMLKEAHCLFNNTQYMVFYRFARRFTN